LNTGAPPSEQWAEEWLHDWEILSSFILEMGIEGDLILVALVVHYKRLSLRIRQGKKKITRSAAVLRFNTYGIDNWNLNAPVTISPLSAGRTG
jgi:hypothetical protein